MTDRDIYKNISEKKREFEIETGCSHLKRESDIGKDMTAKNDKDKVSARALYLF